jgi:hypothetical protein
MMDKNFINAGIVLVSYLIPLRSLTSASVHAKPQLPTRHVDDAHPEVR